MAGNPFDFNRNGRWSTSERAFTHYGVDPLVRGGGSGSPGCGSGCLGCLTLLALCCFVYLGWLVFMLLFSPGA